jgi:hypothetical protein
LEVSVLKYALAASFLVVCLGSVGGTSFATPAPPDSAADAPPAAPMTPERPDTTPAPVPSVLKRRLGPPYDAPRIFGIPPDPSGEGDFFMEFHPEYRVRLIRVDPLEVNGTRATEVAWAEQRLRIDGSFGKRGVGAIHIQADILDGVLWGDNGEFGGDPEPTSGVGLSSKQPNLSGRRVGLLPGGDPLNIDDYGPTLGTNAPIEFNAAYGEVLLPFGVLRIGRMPIADGGTVSINDGRSGRNRWGASWYNETSDRILFGTKVSELVGVLRDGKDHVIDRSLDDGVFMGLVYDHLVEDTITNGDDDLQSLSIQLDWRSRAATFLTDDAGPLRLTGTFTYRWNEQFSTEIYAMPFRLQMELPYLRFLGEFTYVTGSTRELSAGFAKLVNAEVVEQDITIMSGRAILDIPVDDFTFSFEYGFASGDDDPRSSTPLTVSTWPRDTNLGLLLFEQTLAFQSARSAAVGIENLRQLDADSFPLTEVSTEGRVTNTHAIFPQLFYDPTPELRLKAGVLFAFAAVPVTDPIQTLLAFDGDEISDDRLNYNGGKGGNYWGTEIDLGVEYRYLDFFEVALEAAVLLPGSGLEDENGDAVTSYMIESRFTFRL